MRPAASLALALSLALLAGPVLGSGVPDVGLPTQESPVSPTLEAHTWAALANGSPAPDQAWRVPRGTGNCCENYLAAGADGTLVDFGGTYLKLSRDAGLTWSRVEPTDLFVGGEGAVAMAPNGDILGVAWDVYSGDRLVAFKHDAAGWRAMPAPVHSPFFDRPWLAVIPGAFAGGASYMAVLKGGVGTKDILAVSLDGLNYDVPSNKWAGAAALAVQVQYLDGVPDPSADWVQPARQGSMFPLGQGLALARNNDFLLGGCPWVTPDATLQWHCTRPTATTDFSTGTYRRDSRGWLHFAAAGTSDFTYGVSTDGGRTWSTRSVALPPGLAVESWDFKVNGQLDLAVWGVHAHRASTSTDQDVVLKLEGATSASPTLRALMVGDGDIDFGAGAGANLRFDFATVAILPSGKVATSFGDDHHHSPSVAVEL
jgi:hypothetical protein